MNQPIICFEGPSGIGKTTMGKLLSADYNIVPEVNLLYKRPAHESKYWYHEKQVARYELCKKANTPSILDGDVFQPIWYNWVCSYPSNFLPKKETHQFYKTNLLAGKIAFPDLYIIFQATEKELWNRKERDKTRQRRNFEKHLKIIEPLKTYYQFLDQETAIEMKFLQYDDLAETKTAVLATIESLDKKDIDGVKTFEQIEGWINQQDSRQ